jgi:hypothetical protein
MRMLYANWREPVGMVVGYARVSAGSQSYEDQVAQLEKAGAVRIFKEKGSGARSRPWLRPSQASTKATYCW